MHSLPVTPSQLLRLRWCQFCQRRTCEVGGLTQMKSRLILAGATLALTSAVAVAQTTAKPSPYEGTSQPPASDVIRATDSPAVTPVTPPAAVPAPAPAAVQQTPPAATHPAPVQNPDYGIVEVPVTTEAGAAAQKPGLQTPDGR